jgi:phenylacetate-CoA ligase
MPDLWNQGSITLGVMAATRLPAPRIAALQAERLAQLLAAAVSGSVFWGRTLRGHAGAATRLADLPVVGKAELMRHFDDWVTDPKLTLAALRAFTADPARIAEPYLGRYAVWESSGSSGEPGLFVQDEAALAVYDALEAVRRDSPRPWQRLFDPLLMSERIAFVGATSGHFASHVSVKRARRLNPWGTGQWQSLSILQPVADLVEALNRGAPTIIATYPTAAAMLADEAERGALRVPLQELWTGGETLSPAVRARIERVFGCPLRNSYGASEFLPIAWECGQGRLHVNADWVILEPVDASFRPVPPGQRSHTTLLTNLANHVQPLIRYDLGDQLTVSPTPCGCGCTLVDVLGRRDDAITMPGRDGRPVTLLPLALTTVLEDDAGVFDFQLEQEDAHRLLLRLHGAETGSGRAERCRQALQAFAGRQGLAPFQLRVMEGAPHRRGRSGKVQRVLAMATPR